MRTEKMNGLMRIYYTARKARLKANCAKARAMRRTPNRGAKADAVRDEIADYLARNPDPVAKW